MPTHYSHLITLHYSYILIYLILSTQYLKPSKHYSYKVKKASTHRTASHSTSLRLKGLAQARARKRGTVAHARSRLGEMLARSGATWLA